MSVAVRYTGWRTRSLILAGAEPAWLVRHKRRTYVRQSYLACLPWADRAELRWLDWCRRAWSRATGAEHTLDHIVPLNHPNVCGLTVPWNLRLVPEAVNAAKGNAWAPDQRVLAVLEELHG